MYDGVYYGSNDSSNSTKTKATTTTTADRNGELERRCMDIAGKHPTANIRGIYSTHKHIPYEYESKAFRNRMRRNGKKTLIFVSRYMRRSSASQCLWVQTLFLGSISSSAINIILIIICEIRLAFLTLFGAQSVCSGTGGARSRQWLMLLVLLLLLLLLL